MDRISRERDRDKKKKKYRERKKERKQRKRRLHFNIHNFRIRNYTKLYVMHYIEIYIVQRQYASFACSKTIITLNEITHKIVTNLRHFIE